MWSSHIMSLKTFHLIFIAAAIATSGYFAWWSYNEYKESSASNSLITAIISFIIAIGLVVYGLKTKKKYDS
jgi:hypothetical protein